MIGVFDSGYGGLTVLKELLSRLPEYNYIYLGDNARAPYGNKSQEVIYNYTREAVDFLAKNGCKLIIIACNTVSSGALKTIQQEYLPETYPQIKVLGVIRPVIEEVVKMDGEKRIGVIGTKATIDSGIYQKEINEANPGIKVFEKACPLLVPLVEEGWMKKPETKKILKSYLRPLKNKEIDMIILGCTHYPILINEIKAILNKKTVILNSPAIAAEKTADYLDRHQEIKSRLSINKNKKADCEFYTTDNEEKFKEIGKIFLKNSINEVKKANL